MGGMSKIDVDTGSPRSVPGVYYSETKSKKYIQKLFFLYSWAISGREFFGGDNVFERT
jgi:hypothetical protein